MNIAWILVTLGVAIVCSVAVVMTLVRLPGTWLIVATALGLGWYTSWKEIGTVLVLILAGLAVVGELLESLLSAAYAKRAGASRQALIGGMVGSLIGLILFSCMVPIPIVGSFLGALMGCFLGAMIGENWKKRRMDQSTRVGMAAAWGFVVGAGAKTLVSMVMACVLVASAVNLCKRDRFNHPESNQPVKVPPNHPSTP